MMSMTVRGISYIDTTTVTTGDDVDNTTVIVVYESSEVTTNREEAAKALLEPLAKEDIEEPEDQPEEWPASLECSQPRLTRDLVLAKARSPPENGKAGTATCHKNSR